jgi:hypothetical protein
MPIQTPSSRHIVKEAFEIYRALKQDRAASSVESGVHRGEDSSSSVESSVHDSDGSSSIESSENGDVEEVVNGSG